MRSSIISAMRVSGVYLVLLSASVYQVAAKGVPHTNYVDPDTDGLTVTPLENRGGWVDPEDLTSMPQCIAQQDQSVWLSAMTRCTSNRCTRHFGIICTRHTWLTELNCLNIEISPDVIKSYFPYCSRSVLAKAQLYSWVRKNSGRTWLIDVGDSNELGYLSPASLINGYGTIDVIRKAPTCLKESISASSAELFRHVMASCSFGSVSEHTGNPDRPWEYNGGLHSMIALDFETIGYDLTGGHIQYGDYFDKKCFCDTFTIDPSSEPCSKPGELDLTKERLWMNAVCGPSSLPENWRDEIKTTGFAYIPIKKWHWPACVRDMPKRLTVLPEQCAIDACEIDSDGFCNVVRAVSRDCFCRGITYDSCGRSCHIFETRINYVQWLHGLCGGLENWHGLPNHWKQLAAPTSSELIPWQWTVRPARASASPSISHSKSTPGSCGSTEWKLRSIALVNIATFFAAFLIRATNLRQIRCYYSWNLSSQHWLSKGISISGLQILVNSFNAFIVQSTRGYEKVSVVSLALFWCSMPRLTWLTTLLIGGTNLPFEKMRSTILSLLLSEVILQALSSYYMFTTISYGFEHDFFSGGLEKAKRATEAKHMYIGALIWFLVIIIAFVVVVQTAWKTHQPAEDGNADMPYEQRRQQTTSSVRKDIVIPFNSLWTQFEDHIAQRWMVNVERLERTPLLRSEGTNSTVYGIYQFEARPGCSPQKAFIRLFAAGVISLFVLWIMQWFFWVGFIGVSLEDFCPPNLGLLTVAWIVSSISSIAVAIL